MKSQPTNLELESTLKRVYDEMFLYSSGTKAAIPTEEEEEEDDCSSDGYSTDNTASLSEWEASDSETEEEESRMIKDMVTKAFGRSSSSANLASESSSSSSASRPVKRARHGDSTPSHLNHRLSLSKSAPELTIVYQKHEQPKHIGVNPQEHLAAMLLEAGLPTKTFNALELEGFFSDQSTANYDLAMVKAIREQDLDVLRAFRAKGRSLQCSNKFGESVVHTAGRRGADKVLAYLLHEANVSVRVCCDYGRTPLHDACWTASTNFTVIDMILNACPDMLHLTDKRGFTPLNYVPHDQWTAWCSYLEQRGAERLAAKELL